MGKVNIDTKQGRHEQDKHTTFSNKVLAFTLQKTKIAKIEIT